MRHEFWADRKDVWKWSIALDEADDNALIVYVPMLTDNPDWKPAEKEHTRADVSALFEEERARIKAEWHRRIDALSELCHKRVEVLPDLFVNRNRLEYFKSACELIELSRANRRVVVLLDPDKGITSQDNDKEHVNEEGLTQLKSILKAGDVLLVYQTKNREADNLARNEAVLRSVFNLPVQRVPRQGVVFFKIAVES